MRAIVCLGTGCLALAAVQACQGTPDSPVGDAGAPDIWEYDAGTPDIWEYDAGSLSDGGGIDEQPPFTLDAAHPALTFHITAVRNIASPVAGANGIAWDGAAFWLVSSGNQLSKFDPVALKVLAQLQPQGTTAMYPANTALAWDGQRIWLASGSTSPGAGGIMSAVDPITGAVTTSRGMPESLGVGLTWDGTQLWMTDGVQAVYRISPSDGGITASFPVGSWRGTGIAHHDGELWISDLFDGITVYSTSGTPVAKVVVSSGSVPAGGYLGQLCFVGDQLVTLSNLGITYWDITR